MAFCKISPKTLMFAANTSFFVLIFYCTVDVASTDKWRLHIDSYFAEPYNSRKLDSAVWIDKHEHRHPDTYENSQICDSPDPVVYLRKNLRSSYENSYEKDVSETHFVVHDLRTTKHTKFFGVRSLALPWSFPHCLHRTLKSLVIMSSSTSEAVVFLLLS